MIGDYLRIPTPTLANDHGAKTIDQYGNHILLRLALQFGSFHQLAILTLCIITTM
jgi:hypothetical protein